MGLGDCCSRAFSTEQHRCSDGAGLGTAIILSFLPMKEQGTAAHGTTAAFVSRTLRHALEPPGSRVHSDTEEDHLNAGQGLDRAAGRAQGAQLLQDVAVEPPGPQRHGTHLEPSAGPRLCRLQERRRGQDPHLATPVRGPGRAQTRAACGSAPFPPLVRPTLAPVHAPVTVLANPPLRSSSLRPTPWIQPGLPQADR